MGCLIVSEGGGTHPDAPPGTAFVRDPEGSLHRRYGAEAGALYLVRPDGYIGYRDREANLGEIRRYLGKVFSSPSQ